MGLLDLCGILDANLKLARLCKASYRIGGSQQKKSVQTKCFNDECDLVPSQFLIRKNVIR